MWGITAINLSWPDVISYVIVGLFVTIALMLWYCRTRKEWTE